MKNIPFSPPRIDEKTIAAVTDVLRSGWITTGPKTRLLEEQISAYCGAKKTLCLNSWTNAAELVLRWFGVGPGDEVILPAYTYAATANIVIHVGATPVMVDCEPDGFLLDINALAAAINERTKVIMPVDIGGLPVNYTAIMKLAMEAGEKGVFKPSNEIQQQLARPLVLSDAAHSFGASYCGKRVGSETDIAGFSFHAVKNLTTAEGGAITLNLPEPFDNDAIWKALNISALHGQTKDALSKTQAGQWRYDVVEAGFKCNMTDLQAAIGLVELERYNQETLPRRAHLCQLYSKALAENKAFILPVFHTAQGESSYHLYALRIADFTEDQRDQLITYCAEKGIALNVHFQPLPLLSFYKNKGYSMSDYPNAWKHYAHEISLPIYYDLKDTEVLFICATLQDGYSFIKGI